jgi:hypothetical protein
MFLFRSEVLELKLAALELPRNSLETSENSSSYTDFTTKASGIKQQT